MLLAADQGDRGPYGSEPLDYFGTRDVTPPAVNWLDGSNFTNAVGDGLITQSGVMVRKSTGGYRQGGHYARGGTYGGGAQAVEVWTQFISVASLQEVALAAMMTSPTSPTGNNYTLGIDWAGGGPNPTLYINREVAGVSTTIIPTFTTTPLAAGDSLGMVIIPSGSNATVELWKKTVAGSWTLVTSASDTSPLTAAGVMAVQLAGGQGFQLSLLGGGNVTTTPPAQNVSPTGLGTAADFGAPTFTTGNVDVAITALDTAAAFGAPTFAVTVDIPGLDSAADFGAVNFISSFAVPGLGSAADLGAPTFNVGNVNVSIPGLDSAASFGAPTLLPGPVSISPVGLGSAAAFGSPSVNPGNVNVAISGLDSVAAFGSLAATPGNVNVAIIGLDSVAAFGVPSLTTPSGSQNVDITGLASAAAFGTLSFLVGGVNVQMVGLDSAAAFGVLTPDGGASSPDLNPAARGYYFS